MVLCAPGALTISCRLHYVEANGPEQREFVGVSSHDGEASLVLAVGKKESEFSA